MISAASVSSLVPKPEQTSIHFGDSTLEADSFALEYANETGILKEFGFTSVDRTYFDGDVKTRQAMIAGQIDVMIGSAAASVTSLTTDTPFFQVAMFIDKPTDDLVAVSSVKSPADLKGKKIGISSFGTDSHASVVLALKALGISSSDVTIVPIGGQSARIAALSSGAVQAAPVDSSLEARMQQQGMNVLVRLASAPVVLARTGMEVPAAWAQKNPNTVQALVAATMLALHNMAADPAAAAPAYFKWIGTGDLPTAQHQLDEYLPLALYDVRGAADGYPALQEVLASVDPRIASVDITKAYDYSAVDKLKANGFEKALGLPGA